MRQQSLPSVRKLNELVHECNVHLAVFRHAVQGIGMPADGVALRRECEASGRACLRACEAARNCVLPQLRHDGEGAAEFTRAASQFIGCVAAFLNEMRRCAALEATYSTPVDAAATPAPAGGGPLFKCADEIAGVEAMQEHLENLITVHFSTTEGSPENKVTPRRRRGTSCRPQCVCSKLKTSYA